MRAALSLLALVFVVGCSTVAVSPDDGAACDPEERDEPNGYCEADDACDAADHCLVTWCHGTKDECEPVNRCTPKAHAGDWCEGPNWCRDGLVCVIRDGFEAGVCEPG